jgi:hypothetical protein
MRIRSDRITTLDLQAACRFTSRASESYTHFDWVDRGSRQYRFAYDVWLYGDGTANRRRSGHDHTQYAATWHQWGHFINYLFQVDPYAHIGTYQGAQDFEDKTHGAFPPTPGVMEERITR